MAHVVIDGVPLNSINHKRPAVEGVPSPPSFDLWLSSSFPSSCHIISGMSLSFGSQVFGLGLFSPGKVFSARDLAFSPPKSIPFWCSAPYLGDLLQFLWVYLQGSYRHGTRAFVKERDGILSYGLLSLSNSSGLALVENSSGFKFLLSSGGFGSSGLACGMSTSVRDPAFFPYSSLSSGCVALNVGDLLQLLVDPQCHNAS